MVSLMAIDVPQAAPVQPVRLALFEEVREVPALIEKVRSGTVLLSLIDARTILSTQHLLAAVFRALNDQSNKRMKTRNIHSEVLLALSLNNNIVEAYRKFGIQPDTTSLIAVKIGGDDDAAVKHELEQVIDASCIEASESSIMRNSNLDTVRKNYKLGKSTTDVVTEEERRRMEADVIECIALRGAS